MSSSSQDSSHRCLVSLLLAASVSSTDQSAQRVSHAIISGWEWRNVNGLARTLDGEVLELVILLKGGGRLLLGLLGLGLVGGRRLVVLLGL